MWFSPGRWADRSRQLQGNHRQILAALQIAYCALVGFWLLREGNWPTPDQVILAMLGFAIIMSRGFTFVRDWLPFLILLLSYEGLRGLANGLWFDAHIQFPIDVDEWMFGGHLPTIWLQERLWDPDNLRWYDYLAAFMHPMHFIVPLALGFVLWMRNRRLYWKFMASYLLLTYAGFVTYVLYPMAPPWWASSMGVIPHVDIILGQVLWTHSASHPIVLAYGYFDANPVAAMPSLHAAFPVLVWLIVWRLRPRWGWATVAYPLLMDFAVVYLGEHYVIDVIAGTAYGAAAFAAVWLLPDAWRRWRAGRCDALVPAALVPKGEGSVPE